MTAVKAKVGKAPAERAARADAKKTAKAPPAAVPFVLFGASGMLAGEFLRLCEGHPALRAAFLVSRDPGSLGSAHPHLSPHDHPSAGGAAIPAVDPAGAAEELASLLAGGRRAAAVFALPHGESPAVWRSLRARLGPLVENLFVVDLAADYRFSDPQLYAAAYGEPHADPGECQHFAYGLPELGRASLGKARRVAAPGCFATAMQLAVVPAARAGVLDRARPWILLGITGSSGSGNTPRLGTHHPFREGNLWVYSQSGHRHEHELAQALAPSGAIPTIHFSAASGPFVRGIHLTAWLPLRPAPARPLDTAAARAIYAEAYAGEPFVEVLAEGAPDIRRVAGSNRASLAVSVRGDLLHVLLTLDNLIKGGAGQGLQCLNRMLGFPESWGLPRAGLGVC